MKTKVKISLIQKIRTSIVSSYINITGRLRRLTGRLLRLIKILFTNWPLDSINYVGYENDQVIQKAQEVGSSKTSAHNKALIARRLSKWYVRFIGYPVKIVPFDALQSERAPFSAIIYGRLFVKKGMNIIYFKRTLASETSLLAFSDNSCLVLIRRSPEDKCFYILHSNF